MDDNQVRLHRPGRLRAAYFAAGFGFTLCASPVAYAQHDVVATTSSVSESRQITVEVERAPLAHVIELIAQQAGLQPSYDVDILPQGRRITLHLKNATVSNAFAEALRGTGLAARVRATGNVFIVRDGTRPQGDEGVSGRITDAKTGRAIGGAAIAVTGASTGAQSAEDGTYRLALAAGEYTIVVRRVGYQRETRRVVVASGQTTGLDVALTQSASVLDEVIVTGTVVATERKAIPTPITVITADDIERRGVTRLEQLFRGDVPGVFAAELGSEAYENFLGNMATAKVYARGSSSLNGAPNPLKTYVDGIELLDPNALGTIDPRSIERIEIVTGPQAATIYGSGALGGVMQIFTKKGSGRSAPDMTLTLKYGMLETNVASGRAPSHNDVLNISGGSGPEFTYALSGSYDYTGQWQPGLLSRRTGFSAGLTHTRGPVSANATVALTNGMNGTYTYGYPLLAQDLVKTGEWSPSYIYLQLSELRSNTSAQTGGVTIDVRARPWWHHQMVIGRNQTSYSLDPIQPSFAVPTDTYYVYQNRTGQRTSLSYNTTLSPGRMGPLSQTLTLGATGSSSTQRDDYGRYMAKEGTSMDGSRITVTPEDRTWGGFGSWQVGLFDQLFLTFGLRAERNVNYGSAHKLDWTPTNGITYTRELGELTVKLLGSYGRATRAPSPSMRLDQFYSNSYGTPSIYLVQKAAPHLTPEYERGPQGGIEMYYGSLGSLTVNHYAQSVTDMIQAVAIDSTYIDYGGFGYYDPLLQYQNVARIKKYGWEMTGSLNLGVLSFRGTYAWNESRVQRVTPSSQSSTLYPGMSFVGLPTHTGSLSAGYAHGGTSLLLMANAVGPAIRMGNDNRLAQYSGWARLSAYASRVRAVSIPFARPGYVKTNLTASHRLTSWMSATLDITNLGNSFGSEVSAFSTTLGRTTTLGVALRYPTTR